MEWTSWTNLGYLLIGFMAGIILSVAAVAWIISRMLDDYYRRLDEMETWWLDRIEIWENGN